MMVLLLLLPLLQRCCCCRPTCGSGAASRRPSTAGWGLLPLLLLLLLCGGSPSTTALSPPKAEPSLLTAPHQEVLTALAASHFQCQSQQYPGYYVDVSTRCRGFHVCQADGRHDLFVCPNNTVFQQRHLVCDWSSNVDCDNSPAYYSVNAWIFSEDTQQESPSFRNLLQPHLQPHLQQLNQMLQHQQKKSAESSALGGTFSHRDESLGSPGSGHSFLESLTEHITHATPLSFLTTGSVMDLIGGSSSGVGDGSRSSLILTPFSHHPSW